MQHGNKHTCGKSLVISNVINDTQEFALVKNIYILNASVYCQANIFMDAEKLVDYTPYYKLQ